MGFAAGRGGDWGPWRQQCSRRGTLRTPAVPTAKRGLPGATRRDCDSTAGRGARTRALSQSPARGPQRRRRQRRLSSAAAFGLTRTTCRFRQRLSALSRVPASLHPPPPPRFALPLSLPPALFAQHLPRRALLRPPQPKQGRPIPTAARTLSGRSSPLPSLRLPPRAPAFSLVCSRYATRHHPPPQRQQLPSEQLRGPHPRRCNVAAWPGTPPAPTCTGPAPSLSLAGSRPRPDRGQLLPRPWLPPRPSRAAMTSPSSSSIDQMRFWSPSFQPHRLSGQGPPVQAAHR